MTLKARNHYDQLFSGICVVYYIQQSETKVLNIYSIEDDCLR